MRNYWLRIALGALAIFTVGMIGVTLARQGVGRVRHVVEGSGPITVPLAFIPFHLNGEKLGTVSRVVLLREAPKQISAVQLEAKVRDSAVARGLAGCRLTANLERINRPVPSISGPVRRRLGCSLVSMPAIPLPAFRSLGRPRFRPAV